jgi:hypothetical protein
MKFVPNAVSSNVGRVILKTQKASPQTLFVVGLTGFVVTTVLACRATLKVDEVLEKAQQDFKNVDELHHGEISAPYATDEAKKDKAYVYLRTSIAICKLYSPAIVAGTISVAALTGSHNILNKRNAGLAAAYAAVEKGFADYRNRVREEFGEDKERELHYPLEVCEIEEEKDGKKSKKSVKIVAPGSESVYAKFFDQFSRNWQREPEYNRIFLNCQQNYANDLLKSRGHVFLNEVYDMLGLERTKAGAVVGWIISDDGDNYIDFGMYNSESESARRFVNGLEGAILLDFNVDGVIYDKI